MISIVGRTIILLQNKIEKRSIKGASKTRGRELKMSADKPALKGLEDLPVFAANPFHRESGQPAKDVHVCEVARITYKTTPQTYPPYQRQDIVSVVGRSSDSNLIYLSRGNMLRKNGELVAIWTDAGPIGIDDIERYEILVPHDELTTPQADLRI